MGHILGWGHGGGRGVDCGTCVVKMEVMQIVLLCVVLLPTLVVSVQFGPF